jgi:beta-lactamase class A
MFIYRRHLAALALGTLGAMPVVRTALAGDDTGGLQAKLQQFEAFPGTKSFRIDVGSTTVASQRASVQLFVASAVKTFILAQYLRGVEAGRLSLDEQLPVDDSVRTSDSPVLLNLTGTTLPLQGVLEAMIRFSDNTATDIALARIGPDQVRQFIAEAGLQATLIPDSLRLFFSYNVGAPPGVDIGWTGVQEVLASKKLLGPARPPLNHQETLASSADDLVGYYQRALAGNFFTEPTTLAKFKFIHLINYLFPPDTVGYAKGGNVDVPAPPSPPDLQLTADFHAISYAGQMVVGTTPVTFCFIVNWTSPTVDDADLTAAFADLVSGSLEIIKQSLL